MNKVSLVTVFYNAEKNLDTFIEGLEKNKDFIDRVICVDNASSDNTEKFFKEKVSQHPFLKNSLFIKNTTNTGYPAAVNQGVREALKTESPIVVINNDVILSSAFLQTALKDASESQALVLGVCGYHDKFDEYYFGYSYKPSLASLVRFNQVSAQNFTVLKERGVKTLSCDFPSGFFLLFSPEFFKKIGFYDERFFFSGDEMDFAARVSSCGGGAYVSLAATHLIDHKTKATSHGSLIKNKYYIKGYITLLKKHQKRFFSFHTFILLFVFLIDMIRARPSLTPLFLFWTIKNTFMLGVFGKR